jgi:hypothetical protein
LCADRLGDEKTIAGRNIPSFCDIPNAIEVTSDRSHTWRRVARHKRSSVLFKSLQVGRNSNAISARDLVTAKTLPAGGSLEAGDEPLDRAIQRFGVDRLDQVFQKTGSLALRQVGGRTEAAHRDAA